MTEYYEEKPVQIVVNGRAAITLMTHAKDPENLVFGALFTERVVESVEDIESVVADETQVSVVTKNPYTILLSRKTVLAGCGGASSFLDSGKLGTIVSVPDVSLDTAKKAASLVPESVWFAGGLFTVSGELLCTAEDIASQNVFDQLIGCALRQGVDLSKTFAVLKGNCVVESMRKAVIAGIPALYVTGAVTAAAKNTADEAGLLLL
ncbi:MAG: sulfurtransferase FdhD [Methanocorpusculum parvum]|nr:sulfurtransferase FdhD [Methanocorpusculum parvum]